MVAGCALMHTSRTDQHSCANCIRPRPGDTAKRSARRREGQCKPLVVWGDWRRAAAHACSPGGGPIPGGQAGVAAVRKPAPSQHMAGVRCANRRCGLGQPQSSNGAVSIRGCTSVGACAGRAQGSCQDVGRPGQALLRTQPLWSQEKRAAAPPAAARTGSPSPATTVHNTTTTPVAAGRGFQPGPARRAAAGGKLQVANSPGAGARRPLCRPTRQARRPEPADSARRCCQAGAVRRSAHGGGVVVVVLRCLPVCSVRKRRAARPNMAAPVCASPSIRRSARPTPRPPACIPHPALTEKGFCGVFESASEASPLRVGPADTHQSKFTCTGWQWLLIHSRHLESRFWIIWISQRPAIRAPKRLPSLRQLLALL